MGKAQKKRRTFTHFTHADRDRVEILRNKGHTQKEIAAVLGKSASAVSRELHRNPQLDRYRSVSAQRTADAKRRNSTYVGLKIEKNLALRAYIIVKLKESWSPHEIAGRMKKDDEPFYASSDTIYKWLYSARGQAYCHYLCTQRYRKKKQKNVHGKRTMIPNRKPLAQRSLGATNRSRFGHFEGDCFVSPRKSGSRVSGVMLCDRKSKYLMGQLIPHLKPESFNTAVAATKNSITKMLSLSLDNGIENKYHEQLPMDCYFCAPHAPWEKGQVEQSIALLRRWFVPKGTDLATLSEREYQKYLDILNKKPRRSLGWKSAQEVMEENGLLVEKKDNS